MLEELLVQIRSYMCREDKGIQSGELSTKNMMNINLIPARRQDRI